MNNTPEPLANKPSFPWRKALYTAALALLIPLIILAVFVEDPIELILGYGQFFLLGLAGAIVANSTGAGGGVVFIPAFTSMGVVGVSALGTSLAIQSFGMTAGSISWLHSIHTHQHGGKQAVKLTHRLLLLAGLSSVAGMLSAQYLFAAPTWPVDAIFKVFSIIFGLVLLFTILQRKAQSHTHYSLRRRDQPLIALVCFFGGVITSWISVGSGEWLAILLFFLGYPTMVVVCVAVCISSMTVLVGLPYHIWVVDSVSWKILLFAAPAAVVGGSIARLLAQRLGPVRLKSFFAVWVLATGLAM